MMKHGFNIFVIIHLLPLSPRFTIHLDAEGRRNCALNVISLLLVHILDLHTDDKVEVDEECQFLLSWYFDIQKYQKYFHC